MGVSLLTSICPVEGPGERFSTRFRCLEGLTSIFEHFNGQNVIVNVSLISCLFTLSDQMFRWPGQNSSGQVGSKLWDLPPSNRPSQNTL